MKRIVSLAALLAATVVPGRVAGAEASPGVYTAVARADAAALEIITPQAPAVSLGGGQLTYATPATAQASVGTLTGSEAFASSPYPGDLIVGLPGVVNGLGSPPVPLPDYPAFVASSYPTAPQRSLSAGPYALTAQSEADNSKGDARIGLSTSPPQVASSQAQASAVRAAATGVLTADAVATTDPLSFGAGLLVVGEVHSAAHVVLDPRDPSHPRRQSSLSIGKIEIAGVAVALTEKGLEVGGGQSVPVDLTALKQQLAAAGLSLEYVPGSSTATSVTTASLRIGTTRTVPTVGPVTVHLILGQVSARVAAGAGSLRDAVQPLDTLPGPAGDSPLLTSAPQAVSVGQDAPREPRSFPPRRAMTAARLGLARPVPLAPADVWFFYPVLVLAGIAALLSARLRTRLLRRSERSQP